MAGPRLGGTGTIQREIPGRLRLLRPTYQALGHGPSTSKSGGARSRHGTRSGWAQFWSHSRPSGGVHRRSRDSHLGRSRTVATGGERWSALLESVLGATPQEFESLILR